MNAKKRKTLADDKNKKTIDTRHSEIMHNYHIAVTEEIPKLIIEKAALKEKAGKIDASLGEHVSALETKAIKRLTELEKKLLRAEKRKFDVQQRQITAFKQSVFPSNSLQERTDNLSAWYASYGKGFMQMIYEASLGLEPDFIRITVKD